jgi:hypothetical protein
MGRALWLAFGFPARLNAAMVYFASILLSRSLPAVQAEPTLGAPEPVVWRIIPE